MSIIDTLFPHSGCDLFFDKYWLKKPLLEHADVSRLPKFLQSPHGDAAGLHCLENWPKERRYDFAVVDEKDYSQFQLANTPPMALYRLGAPIMLPKFNEYVPELNEWFTRVITELDIDPRYATINGWFSKQTYGLGVHYDPGEVILIQLEGNKKLRIGRNTHTVSPDFQFELNHPCPIQALPLYVDGFPESEPEGLTEIELNPGSVLSMPRGWWHDSIAMDTSSIAIALYFNSPTVSDFILSYLHDAMRLRPEMREPLLGYRGTNASREKAKNLIKKNLGKLPEIVNSIEAEQVITHAIPIQKRKHLPKNTKFTLQKMPESNIVIEVINHENCKLTVTSKIDKTNTNLSKINASTGIIPLITWIDDHSARFTFNQAVECQTQLNSHQTQEALEALLESNYVAIFPFDKIRR